MTSPLLISKKTAVANLSAPYDFPDNRIFISGNHCVILSHVQTVTFQKVKYKALSFLTLSEGLISQCSFSLSSLNPAADNTFLHSLTTETKKKSFSVKTT